MIVIYEIVRVLHILGGIAGLALMVVPLVSRKGGAVHRRVGRWFVIAMTIAGVTGLLMSASWIALPTEYGPVDAGAESVRRSGLFLGLIAMISLAAVRQLVTAPRRKRETQPRPEWIDVALPAAMAVVGTVAIAVGATSMHVLLIVFGTLALVGGIADVRFARRPLPTRMAWWYAHMRGAMVAIITGLTAFLVLGGRRWLGELVPGPWMWVLWIAPSLVTVPLFQLWIRAYRRRFEAHAPRRGTP